MIQTGGPRSQKMPARLAARGGGWRRNYPDGRAEKTEEARPSGGQRRRAAAELPRRAGREARRCPPVWRPEEEGGGGITQTGGPRRRKKPARLAARGGRWRRNYPDGRAEKPEEARPSGGQMRRVATELPRRAGRDDGRCPPVWRPEEEGGGGITQTGGPRRRKKPARLAARGGGSRRNYPDGRAEKTEDARPSGGQRRRVATELPRRAGREDGRSPPVWRPEEEGRDGITQTGGPRRRKMPARLAARGGGWRRNYPDGRPEKTEEARPSGGQRRRVATELPRRAGREDGRSPPVWRPEEEGRDGITQTGGPRRRKKPARLAARGGGSRRNYPDGRAEKTEDARPSGGQRRRVATELPRRAGREDGRCPPVWRPEEEGGGGITQTGGPRRRKKPARLAARGGGWWRNYPDGRAEKTEVARPSGGQRRRVAAE